MSLNRRHFLKNSSLVAMGLTVPGFVGRTALAAPTSEKKGAKDTILVVVQLTGGNDGINTVIPYNDPEYAKSRPTLKIAASQVKKVNDAIGLHPSCTGLAELLEDQALGIVQGVGYPNPSQSHFDSMDIWQSANTGTPRNEGWIGRAMKSLPQAPAFHLGANNETSPLAVAGAPVRVPSIATLDDFQLKTASSSGADMKDQKSIIEGAAQPGTNKPSLLDFVQRTATNTYADTKRLQEIGKNYQPKATYPQTGLANRLKLAAQLIDADLGARVFYVSIDGFDTHANQANAHANLMTQVSGAITAFYKDLAARGHKDRLLVMTFSEFGRRVRENGSKGTDHGSGSMMFLAGGKVKPGLVGAHPNMADAADNNLKFHTDFRQVYASVLDTWLGVPSRDVLGKEHQPVDIFKS